MLRIAIQAKGRLNEQSIELLSEAGIRVAESKRKLISRAEGFPLEVLYLRDDDIPQAVSMGVADLGIVGLNEVAEKGFTVEQVMDLGFGGCRISLAVPKSTPYEGPDFFRGKRVAIVDDVISTGASLAALEKLIAEAGGEVEDDAAAFAAGGPSAGLDASDGLRGLSGPDGEFGLAETLSRPVPGEAGAVPSGGRIVRGMVRFGPAG